ncbi:MAG TPA: flagellar motor switch protein FliN [Candidatus Sulfopaludibacter sp.]|jgi:flagellar motor switch protein FliN/FliY|nr:flagellar motor switch protein FliN [Candidatus Sulfopaludibacter sp.]
MSAEEKTSSMPMSSVKNVKQLLDEWVEALAQVLESMTDQKPETHWQIVNGELPQVSVGTEDYLWWQQAFQLPGDVLVWVGAPKTAWEFAGTLTLKAAGLETVETGEAKNTWFEILGQSLSVMARSIGSLMGREVTCDTGSEQAADSSVQEWVSAALTFGDTPLPPLLISLSPKLLETISAPVAAPETHSRSSVPHEEPDGDAERFSPTASRTMDLLLDVDLPISISFGKAQLPMKDVLKLTTGSIVELNRSVNDQVEVLVNHCLIARGEVVVVDGNYGVRIQEIASRQDRLRSLK